MSAVLDDSIGFDEPAEATATPSNDRNVAIINQDIGRVQNALSEFDRVSAGLAALEERYPKDAVYPVTTTKGMKDAVEHRAAWRDPRITVEKARKMAKAPLLALGKSVDARAAWLTERLREGEDPVDRQIKVEEARREEERQARINAEAGRVLAIQEALAEIAQDVQIACGKTSADVQALLDRMRSTGPDPLVFQEMIESARASWAAGISKLETAHKAKLWDEEQEAQRVAAEAQRQREQAAADAERARVAEEQRVEAARLKAQADALAEQKRRDDESAAARLAELERREREFAAREEAARKAAEPPAAERVIELTPGPVHCFSTVPATQAAVTPIEPAPAAAEVPTLKLGDINALIASAGLKTDAEGLAQLGFDFTPARGSKLYFASQQRAMLQAMVDRLQVVMQGLPA